MQKVHKCKKSWMNFNIFTHLLYILPTNVLLPLFSLVLNSEENSLSPFILLLAVTGNWEAVGFEVDPIGLETTFHHLTIAPQR